MTQNEQDIFSRKYSAYRKAREALVGNLKAAGGSPLLPRRTSENAQMINEPVTPHLAYNSNSNSNCNNGNGVVQSNYYHHHHHPEQSVSSLSHPVMQVENNNALEEGDQHIKNNRHSASYKSSTHL